METTLKRPSRKNSFKPSDGADDKVASWTVKINAAWNKSFEAIIETGRLLIQAQDELKYGAWGQMFETGELPFREDTAGRLMAIARHERLSDSATWRNLPLSYRSLSELARLSPEMFDEAIRRKDIYPGMKFQDAVEVGKGLTRAIEDEVKEETKKQQEILLEARKTYVLAIKGLTTAKGRAAEVAELMRILMTPMSGLESLGIGDWRHLKDEE